MSNNAMQFSQGYYSHIWQAAKFILHKTNINEVLVLARNFDDGDVESLGETTTKFWRKNII